MHTAILVQILRKKFFKRHSNNVSIVFWYSYLHKLFPWMHLCLEEFSKTYAWNPQTSTRNFTQRMCWYKGTVTPDYSRSVWELDWPVKSKRIAAVSQTKIGVGCNSQGSACNTAVVPLLVVVDIKSSSHLFSLQNNLSYFYRYCYRQSIVKLKCQIGTLVGAAT